jgi:hypothetical protein
MENPKNSLFHHHIPAADPQISLCGRNTRKKWRSVAELHKKQTFHLFKITVQRIFD